MRKLWTVLGAFLILALLFSAGAHRTPDPPPPSLPRDSTAALRDFLWPTDAGRVVTSTFGEFRSSHFHTGIDISTGDLTGYRVFASRGGYVLRISVNPNGYGKRIVLQHPDGFRSSYSHLRGFAAPIEALVRHLQDSLQRYPVSVDCAPGALHVARGDLIAYTGDTGAGTPHLHFEIFCPEGDPINPLLCPALACPDNIPPTIGRIAVIPLEPASTVEGSSEPFILQGRRAAEGFVRINGRAGFAVEARDRAEGSRFRRSGYKQTLEIDNRPYFTSRMDRIAWDSPRAVGLHYDWPLLHDHGGRFEHLYREDTVGLPPLSFSIPGAGIIDTGVISTGTHSFRIVTEDICGNRAETRGTFSLFPPLRIVAQLTADSLRVLSPGQSSIGRILLAYRRQGAWAEFAPDVVRNAKGELAGPVPAGPFDVLRVTAEDPAGVSAPPGFVWKSSPPRPASLTLQHEMRGDFLHLLLATDGVFTEPPEVIVYEGASSRVVPLDAHDISSSSGRIRPDAGVAGPRRLVAQAVVNGRRMQANGELSLYPVVPGRRGSYSFDHGNLILRFDSTSVFTPVLLRIEGSALQGGYELEPREALFRDGLEVFVRMPRGELRTGLFVRGSGSWSLVQGPRSDSGYAGTLARSLGELRILADSLPPSVSRLKVARGSAGRPSITFRFSDDLAGVDYQELKTYIDGKFVIPEVDGEHRRAEIRPAEPLSPGTHQITIRLKDRLGNASTESRRFAIR